MKATVTAILMLAAHAMTAQTIRFDDASVGTLPSGWTAGMTHQGGPPNWRIVRDPSAPSQPNVLAQTSTDATGGRFPFAVYDRASFKDGSVGVRFKAVAGSVDQAAGLVWRFRDAGNYYIVRANALEGNVVLYKVEKGERISLAPKGMPSRTYGVKHTVPKKEWSSLKVDFKGAAFTVSLNGEKIMEVEDGTFSQTGKTGVWTKADSVIHFDDFTISQN